ncbi:MAG: hypothetical protein J7K00_04435 [Candidatus Diapherotrites archaeon]|nr:hypothetical protein [Candidatus Diapherotrites archaeon]
MQTEAEIFLGTKSRKLLFDAEEVDAAELQRLFESQGFVTKFSENRGSEPLQGHAGLARKLFLESVAFFSKTNSVDELPFFGDHFAVFELPEELGGKRVFFACDPEICEWEKPVEVAFKVFEKVAKLRKIRFENGLFVGITSGKKTRNNASFGIPSGGWHKYFCDFGEKESLQISKKLIWGINNFFDLAYIRSDFLDCSPSFLNVFADLVLLGFYPKERLPVFFLNEKKLASLPVAFGVVSHEVEHYLAETSGWKKNYIQAREKIDWDKKLAHFFRHEFYEKNKAKLRATFLKWLNKIFYEVVTDANLYLNAVGSDSKCNVLLCRDREKSWDFRMKVFEKFVRRGAEKDDYIVYFLFSYYPYLLSLYVVENKIPGEKFKAAENRLLEQSKDIAPGFSEFNAFMKKKSIELYSRFLLGEDLSQDVDEVLARVIAFYFSVNREQINSIVMEKHKSGQFGSCEVGKTVNEIVLSSRIISLKKKPNHFQFLFERRGRKFYRFTTERVEKALNDFTRERHGAVARKGQETVARERCETVLEGDQLG